MDIKPTTIIEYEGWDGELYRIAGPGAGNQGVYLAPGEVTGLLDPPVKVIDESVGSFAGSRYVTHMVQRRDLVFAVDILNDQGSKSWLRRESQWRKSWSYNKPGKLSVTTKESGTRTLTVFLAEPPETAMPTDPNMNGANITVMSAVAYDPWWYEEPIEISAETAVDTTVTGTEDLVFDVHPGDGVSGGLNPCDIPIDVQWALEGTGKYVVPDYDFEGGDQANRRISLPDLVPADGDLFITSSRRVEQCSTENDTPYWNRMNGVRFLHKIPEWTESKTFTVTASKTPPGRKVTLFLERPWSRAWGMD